MSRGRTRLGRSRADRPVAARPAAPQFLRTTDYGAAVPIDAKIVAASGNLWIKAFLSANRPLLRRLDLRAEVVAARETRVHLHPGSRIGAIPLCNPNTQKVMAGLLVEPRFRWSALGAVFQDIGFTVEPVLGGAPMVPGSAREVPPWVLAGPVLRRLAALLADRRRGFVERTEERRSPRGRVLWKEWAGHALPRGKWAGFPCSFTEPDDDPRLLAAARWTLSRLADDLSTVPWSPPARMLLDRIASLEALVGPGEKAPPDPHWSLPGESGTLTEGLEAMAWVAEKRGLGGARVLDGLTWDLPIADVWEAWVSRFAAHLGQILGLVSTQFGGATHRLRWSGPIESMGSLIPDVELRGANRVVLIDAKYKRHLLLLRRQGWRGMRDDIRKAHRADLHQALAYAAIIGAERVDTVLAYPHVGDDPGPVAIADLTSGRRRVRLILAALPFAFRGPTHRERTLSQWCNLLAA